MATSSSSFYKGSDELDLTCDVCQHQNKTSIAVSYCETCEEALCHTCDNVHRNQKLTRTHNLVTGDQLIDIKLAKQFREFGNVQDTSHVDDSVPGRKKRTSLSIWSVFSRIKGTSRKGRGSDSRKAGTSRDHDSIPGRKQGTSGPGGSVAGSMPGTSKDHDSVPGRVNYSYRDTDTVPSVLDLSVSDIKHHNVGCKEVLSIVFMPSGHIVLACHDDGLKLLDTDFKQLSQLSLFSVCACKVSDIEVLVSQGGEKQIQLVEVLPKLMTKNFLTIGRECEGVCYHNGEIYVACTDDNRGKGEVRVMSMDGTVIRRLGFKYWSLWRYMFVSPLDVKVNNAGDKVFVTDSGANSVICMDQKGGVLYKYTDTYLRCPTGMLVDRENNVLVTALDLDNVHVINKEGRKHKIVLTRRDGLNAPWCISYRHNDGLLAIGMFSLTKSLVTVKTSLA